MLKDLIENALSSREAARLGSLLGKGDDAWLEVAPSSQSPLLRPFESHLAGFVRLGHFMPFSSVASKCNCGQPLDDSSYHLACNEGGLCLHTT